ncbi:MAG TPA: type VI secretion system baseplate subunit TssG [Polyangiaceae bacterium]|nr:type VI secretion system baseplate subunit TssG [Polyangiaceae bacterium]
MASENWRAFDRVNLFRVNLLHTLHAQPSSYDFHAVMRRLESLFRDMPRWGEALRPADEPVRLGQEPSLAFHGSTLFAFDMATDNRPARLWVNFFGLLGNHGPLPLHLTEYVRSRLRHSGDPTLTAFLNIFNHRMLVLFHRAWSMVRPTVALDRPESNPFDVYVGALMGMGQPELQHRDSVPDHAKLSYVGRFAQAVRNAEGLQAMLLDYFGYPVRVEEFVGEWLELPEESQWRLGWSAEVSKLSFSTVLGRRVWRCDHKFRLVIGPLESDDFRSLLPGNPKLQHLTDFVRAYTGDEYEWDLRLLLADNASRQVKLNRGDRLGLWTQLGKNARGARRDDVIIHPASHQTQRSSRKAS